MILKHIGTNHPFSPNLCVFFSIDSRGIFFSRSRLSWALAFLFDVFPLNLLDFEKREVLGI